MTEKGFERAFLGSDNVWCLGLGADYSDAFKLRKFIKYLSVYMLVLFLKRTLKINEIPRICRYI